MSTTRFFTNNLYGDENQKKKSNNEKIVIKRVNERHENWLNHIIQKSTSSHHKQEIENLNREAEEEYNAWIQRL